MCFEIYKWSTPWMFKMFTSRNARKLSLGGTILWGGNTSRPSVFQMPTICSFQSKWKMLKRLKQPEFPKVLRYSCKKSLSCYGRCKMVSVRGVKQPSSCYTRKFWLHFTLWSRPWRRWVHIQSPGLAVTSSHNHHVGASANRLDAGVFLKEL